MATTSASTQIIEMPGWRPIVRRVATTLVMVSLLPMAVFYTAMSLFGLRTAAVATVGLYYSGLLLNLMKRRPVFAAALLTAALLSIRAVIMFLNGSAYVYFLQPVASTVALAAAIGGTALMGRPVLDKLAHEFCPFPAELSNRLRKARFFSHISLVWSVSYLVNAAATVWLLTTASLGGFILLKSFIGPTVTITAVVTSYLYFRVMMRGEDVRIRWHNYQRWSVAAA